MKTKKVKRVKKKSNIVMFKNKCLKDCHKKHLKKFNKKDDKNKKFTEKNWAEFVKASKKYSDCVKKCDKKGGKTKRKRKSNDNVNKQKKLVLKLMSNFKWPINTSRKNVMRGDQKGYEGFALGMINLLPPNWKDGVKKQLSKKTKQPKYQELYKETKKLMKIGDSAFKFTTIQYNKNQQTDKHKDAKNVGVSYIIGLGNYTGGELIVYDLEDKNSKKINIKNTFYKFNGSNHFHETAPFEGERYSLVFFNV
jgi:hypothetical protein